MRRQKPNTFPPMSTEARLDDKLELLLGVKASLRQHISERKGKDLDAKRVRDLALAYVATTGRRTSVEDGVYHDERGGAPGETGLTRFLMKGSEIAEIPTADGLAQVTIVHSTRHEKGWAGWVPDFAARIIGQRAFENEPYAETDTITVVTPGRGELKCVVGEGFPSGIEVVNMAWALLALPPTQPPTAAEASQTSERLS